MLRMHTKFGAALVRRSLFFVLLALPILPGCFGCGDKAIEDDPTRGRGELDLPTEQIPDQPFGGQDTPIETTQPTPQELDAALAGMIAPVFFAYDSFDLSADARSILASNARIMRDNAGRLMIEGHCDERGTAQYNMALGWKRANEVKRYLVSLGVEDARLETVSYGKEKPFVTGSGESVWSQNRRAHFSPAGR
jgi:peptidoglycan-associated lipoprotein